MQAATRAHSTRSASSGRPGRAAIVCALRDHRIAPDPRSHAPSPSPPRLRGRGPRWPGRARRRAADPPPPRPSRRESQRLRALQSELDGLVGPGEGERRGQDGHGFGVSMRGRGVPRQLDDQPHQRREQRPDRSLDADSRAIRTTCAASRRAPDDRSMATSESRRLSDRSSCRSTSSTHRSGSRRPRTRERRRQLAPRCRRQRARPRRGSHRSADHPSTVRHNCSSTASVLGDSGPAADASTAAALRAWIASPDSATGRDTPRRRGLRPTRRPGHRHDRQRLLAPQDQIGDGPLQRTGQRGQPAGAAGAPRHSASASAASTVARSSSPRRRAVCTSSSSIRYRRTSVVTAPESSIVPTSGSPLGGPCPRRRAPPGGA